jgi:hypothetical protein
MNSQTDEEFFNFISWLYRRKDLVEIMDAAQKSIDQLRD